MFCLVLMKAKVGASRCDLYHTDRRSSVQSKFFFFKYWVGFEEKKRKDLHRLSNFYNWLLICILYQWSFLYWKLKEKKNLYWKKIVWPLNVASPWPGLKFWPLGGFKQFFLFLFLILILFQKDAWFLIWLGSLCVSSASFISLFFQWWGGLGSNDLWSVSCWYLCCPHTLLVIRISTTCVDNCLS